MIKFNQIPDIINYIIVAGIAIFLSYIFGIILSDVAQETVCKETDFANEILCFYFTNEIISISSIFVIIIILALAFKKKFLK